MSIEAMKQALEALDIACAKHGDVGGKDTDWGKWDAAITSLRQAIANEALDKKAENARELGLDYEPVQPEKKSAHESELMMNDHNYRQKFLEKQEPVANYCRECLTYNGHQDGCSHATPQPQREWVGLTDDEIGDALSVWESTDEWPTFSYAARAIEAKLKEKNT